MWVILAAIGCLYCYGTPFASEFSFFAFGATSGIRFCMWSINREIPGGTRKTIEQYEEDMEKFSERMEKKWQNTA